ncbi:hypothetical protein BDV98DRAFT_597546 [Pterulicium gracile]|uniref:F-box domain-containing protein n=1 Tax=Pterulicium gracile TaxID=1884261 RepID=A0A5C3Q8H0_9AGAR|nr:hypothetical protein BDV98DRAFT_597546 [Pterula gracilis]
MRFYSNDKGAVQWCRRIISAATHLQSLKLPSNTFVFGVETLTLASTLRTLHIDGVTDFHRMCTAFAGLVNLEELTIERLDIPYDEEGVPIFLESPIISPAAILLKLH